MKKAFYRKIADDLHSKAGVRKQDVFINLVDVLPVNWSFGNGRWRERLGNADVRTHRVMPHLLIEGGGEKTASANRRSNLATKISDFHNKIGTSET